MRKIRLHILAQTTTCEHCGEYVAHCTCQTAITMCPSCGEHTQDCPCENDYTPFKLNTQFLRPAIR